MGSELIDLLIDLHRDEQVWPNMALAGGPSASRPAAEGRRSAPISLLTDLRHDTTWHRSQ